MIITEIIKDSDGNQYLYTYSNLGYNIERDGIIYENAVDSLDSNRTYIEVPREEESDETDNEEISAEEFMALIEEEL